MNFKTLQKIAFTLALVFASLFAHSQCSATLSGGGDICPGDSIDLTVSFTGDGPWTFGYSLDGVPQPPLTTSFNPFIISVNQVGVYEPTSVETPTCSNGTVSGFALVTMQSIPSATNIIRMCDPTYTYYTVSFEIVGGDPANYTVTPPEGWLDGNVFTSYPIPSGSSYFFEIDDAAGCGGSTVTEFVACGCISQAGTMDQTPIVVGICDNLPAVGTYDYAEVMDADDVRVFVLHTSFDQNLGTVWATNNTPSFSFDPATMFPDVTYYISAIVGNDNGLGFPGFDDPCLSVSAGQHVTFTSDIIYFSVDLGCNGDSSSVEVEVPVGNPPYAYNWSNGETTAEIGVGSSGTYTVVVTDSEIAR